MGRGALLAFATRASVAPDSAHPSPMKLATQEKVAPRSSWPCRGACVKNGDSPICLYMCVVCVCDIQHGLDPGPYHPTNCCCAPTVNDDCVSVSTVPAAQQIKAQPATTTHLNKNIATKIIPKNRLHHNLCELTCRTRRYQKMWVCKCGMYMFAQDGTRARGD